MAGFRIGGSRGGFGGRRGGGMNALKIRLVIALVIAAFAAITYLTNTTVNPITGKKERATLTPDQEVALGLQATPGMIQQFGGEYRSASDQARLDRIGAELLNAAARFYKRKHPDADFGVYEFEFTLLADPQTINAFALPGGQTFITYALYQHLDDAMIAAVMGHEVGHVIERHGAERMAKSDFHGKLAAAGGMVTGDVTGAQATQAMLGLVGASYSRDHERESDDIGYDIMIEAGYDPNAMVDLMNILAEASGGTESRPSVTATHPHPGERAETMRQRIANDYPNGIPPELRRGDGPVGRR